MSLLSCPKCESPCKKGGFKTWQIIVAICFFPQKIKNDVTRAFFHFGGKMRPGPESRASDRMIKMSEISEPNSSTLLGPSNQKSKLTSEGRCAAKHQAQMAIFWRQTDNGAKKRRENGPFWRLFFRC